jgi:hypothetical protein
MLAQKVEQRRADVERQQMAAPINSKASASGLVGTGDKRRVGNIGIPSTCEYRSRGARDGGKEKRSAVWLGQRPIAAAWIVRMMSGH